MRYDTDRAPLLVGVLPEASFLIADVIRRPHISGPIELDFLAISNLYRGPRAHLISIRPQQFPAVEDRDVTFVHCRVKSGTTIRFIGDMAVANNARTVQHYALLHQPPDIDTATAPDFADAFIPDPEMTIFGYGIPDPKGPELSTTLAVLDTFYTRTA